MLLVLTLVLSLFLAACAGGSDDKDEGKTKDNQEDSDRQEIVGGDLVIATLSDAAKLDPHLSTDVPSANIQQHF